MGIEVKREDLFIEKLLSGINLFTGAGFSCLPDEEGKSLPTADDLCPEICEKFGLSYETFGNDLEAICALADEDELDDFLRKKFMVSKINEKYMILNKINLLSYVTTNIDNIIHLAIERNSRYFLQSMTYYGATRRDQAELCYIPLHGEVMNKESKLYFGKFDLAVVDQANSDLFQEVAIKLRNKPVLFWGYGFHDSGVLKTVQKLLSYGPQDIWIQCLPESKKQIALFQSLGCNIIFGNTRELLDWIDRHISDDGKERGIKEIKNNKKLKKYLIPTIAQVPAVPAKDFYIKGITQWYSVLTKQAVELDIVNDVYNLHLRNKNVILIGTDFSGKTTALMQLALKINTINKLYVENLTTEKSNFILNNLEGAEAVIFIDNCEEDLLAYKLLAEAPNISTVATSTDYTFEASKHLLGDLSIRQIYIDDLTKEQARRFYNSIDGSIRRSAFRYKDTENEKFSVLEMMLKNISNSLGMQRVKQLLEKVLQRNVQAFETVALASYLSGNNSALSTDVLFSYFDCNTYEDTKRYVNEANGLLRDLDISVDICRDDQDYYDIRSKLFLYHSKKIFSEVKGLRNAYAEVIGKFLSKVSVFKIYQYHLFRRSAYDAKLYYTLFGEKANKIYETLYEYDQNPYTLQQWALCRAYLKQFKEAFADIDKALRQRPNNFSIKNTSAIILFEANRTEKNIMGQQKRNEAMQILEQCYNNDKRKSYHANRFAEFAIDIFDMDGDDQYIKKARLWLDEIIRNEDVMSRYTKQYDKRLTEIIYLCDKK